MLFSSITLSILQNAKFNDTSFIIFMTSETRDGAQLGFYWCKVNGGGYVVATFEESNMNFSTMCLSEWTFGLLFDKCIAGHTVSSV